MATFQEFLEQKQQQTQTQERPVSDFESFIQRKQTGFIPQASEPRKGFLERQGIVQSILKAPIELGKDIAKLTPEKKELEESRQRLDFMRKRIEDADLDVRQKQIIGNILDDIPPLIDLEKPKTASQVIGDVLGTSLFLAPVGSIIRGGTFAAHLARGGLIGAGFGATESLSEGDDTKDFIKNTILGATIGAPTELVGAVAIKGIGKTSSLIGKVIKPFFQKIVENNPRFLMSIGARLKADFGDEGKEIAERFLTADRTTLQRVGGTLDDLSDKGLFDLDDTVALKLVDALEGRIQVDDSIRNQFEAVDKLRKEIAEEAIKKGVEVRYRGKIPEEVEISPMKVPGLPAERKIPQTIEEFNRFPFKDQEKVFDFMSVELRKEVLGFDVRKTALGPIESLADDIAKGVIKIKGTAGIKTEAIEELGRGNFARIFRKEGPFQSLDELADSVGISSDDLVRKISLAIEGRKELNRQLLVERQTLRVEKMARIAEMKTEKERSVLRQKIEKEIMEKLAEKRLVFVPKMRLIRPFKPRENFFPHLSPATAKLQTGKIREQVLDNAVRIEKFTNKEEATKALDSYLEFVETNGKGGEFWIDWLVATGQAQSKDQARGMTLRFFKKSRLNRFGSLEYARELDFPFYDPDPRRVIPIYTMGAIGRLEEITQFGGKFETIDKLIGAVKRKEGIDVGHELAILVKQVRGAIETSPKRKRISLFLRILQVPKLAFAQILNIGQNLNTLLATDSYSLFRAIPLAFRDEGVRRALQTGSILKSVLSEAHRITGVENQLGEKFLRFVGFTASEKFNRTVSANAGVIYAQRTLEKLRRNPDKAIFRVRLREFSIDPDKALQRGITEEELLRAGQITTELNQFRARPIDLPAFATSPEGKVIFQFKNFAFQQTKFLKNRFKQQVEAGNYGGILRDLLVLSTVFPLTGEVIADIRSLVTGQKRPTNFLDRYLDNLMSVGAFGIFADAWQSAKWGNLSDFALGPTAGTVTEAIERVVQSASRQDINKGDIKFLLRQTGFGRTVANYVFPNDKKEQETFLQTLIDGFDEF